MSHNHESSNGIGFAFFLNLFFALAELTGAVYTNSLSILSNGLHDLGDGASLGIAWIFDRASKKARSKAFSYGYKRLSLLSALINGAILLTGGVFVLSEAIPRLLNPEYSNTRGMIIFAVTGLIINLAAYIRLKRGKTLNEQVSALHLLDDVMGLASVLIISVIMSVKNIPVLDAVLSIVITLYLLYNVIKNLQKTLSIFLQSTPEGINIDKLEKGLLEISGIISVHDLHIWSLDGDQNVFTAHVVVANNATHEEMVRIKRAAKDYVETHGISHATVEIECSDEGCGLLDC